MSEENIERIRALIPPPEVDMVPIFRDAGMFEQTVAALGQLVDTNLESVAVWHGGRTYAGIEGFREMWNDWLEPWATYHTHVEDMLEAGDQVVVLVRDHARRNDTEAELELISGSLWTFRDGMVVRVEFFSNRSEALEAAGLSG